MPRASSRTFPLLLCVLLVAPVAAGTWYSAGSAEPDTPYDTAEYMFQDPPTYTRQVYFNAFPTLGATSINPNVGAAGTRIPPPIHEHWEALLGVWLDCNNDGAIGLVETAQLEYRAELLPASADKQCADAGKNSPDHRDGNLIREFIFIGRQLDCANMPWGVCPPKPTHVHLLSKEVRVWGDAAAPGVHKTQCHFAPIPQGTTASTGGLLAYADCFTDRTVAKTVNEVTGAVPTRETAAMRFEDSGNPHRSGSTLNQPIPFHPFRDPYRNSGGTLDRGTERPMISTHGCDGGTGTGAPHRQSIVLPMPLSSPQFWRARVGPAALELTPDGNAQRVVVQLGGSDGTLVRAIRPPSVDLDGSAWDAAEGAYGTYVDHCTYDPYHSLVDMETAHAAFAGVETDQKPLGSNPKDRNDIVFDFSPGYKHTNAAGVTLPIRNDASPIVPREAQSRPGWYALTATPASHHTLTRTYVNTSETSTYTFYANVEGFEAPSLQLPSGVDNFYYGDEACNGARSGVVHGWNCDPSQWWWTGHSRSSPQGPDKFDLGARVGDVYHLRDVDCYTSPLAAASPRGPCA